MNGSNQITTLNSQDIIEHLTHFKIKDPGFKVFGTEQHQYTLNPVLSEQELSLFESQYNIDLPNHYKNFLLTVGNGGAGPGYGLFKLGTIDSSESHLKKWSASNGDVGQLDKDFPYTDSWNDLSAMPEDLPPTASKEEIQHYENMENDFEDSYFNSFHINGAIPLCHLGCGVRNFLIISGQEKGKVWCDARASMTGIYPELDQNNQRLDFNQWYSLWLNQVKREIIGL